MKTSQRQSLAVLVGAVLFLCASTNRAQDQPSPPRLEQVAGKTETVKVPMATLTWYDMLKVSSAPSTSVGPPKPIPIHDPPGYQQFKDAANERKRQALSQLALNSPGSALSLPTRENPTTLVTTFPGIDFNGSNCGCLPPDPIAAAGPSHIVEAVNLQIRVYDKNGSILLDKPLNTFFAPLGQTSGGDPWVIYDQADGRFIVTSVNGAGNGLLLAVSLDSNPLDGFHEWAIPTTVLPDFQKVGMSQSAIYIADNSFGPGIAEVRVVQLADLLAGSATLTITLFSNITTATGYSAYTIEPALTYGNTQNEYLVASAFPSYRTPTNQLNLFSINTSGTPVLSKMDLNVAAWNEPPSADQPTAAGSVATNSSELLNAVWQNGRLVTAHNVQSADLTAAVAQYFVINLPDSTGIAGASLADTGTVGGAGVNTYYPAISVGSNGQVMMVYNESSLSEYVSSYVASRALADPPGVIGPPLLFAAGGGFAPVAFRWGDYDGISIDPNDNSFWVAAEPTGNNAGVDFWVTEIANVFAKAPSTTALSSNVNPSMFMQPVTLTATITPALGGVVATGTVSFFDDNTGALLGTAVVTGNIAKLTTTKLSVGSHTIEAVYSGDSNVLSSLSPDFSQHVNKATTTTAVVSSLNPSQLGQSVTFTAKVAGKFGGTPTGTVTFKKGTAILATRTLSGGSASFSTSSLAVGSDTITAAYGGDGNFLSSSGSVIQKVNKHPTTTTVSSSLNPSTFGQAVTFKATVSSSGGPPPNGEVVTFKNGSTVLGTGSLSGGIATFTTSTLSVGSHKITAVYPGDATLASSSGSLTQVVNP